MGQSKWASFLEANANLIVGTPFTWAIYHWIAPFILHHPVSNSESWSLTGVFTVASLLRSYLIRRFFNTYARRKPASTV